MTKVKSKSKAVEGDILPAAKMTKIFSTESTSTIYTIYEEQKEGALIQINKPSQEITIKGGAGIAYSDDDKIKRHRDYAVTSVNEKDLALLLAHPVFNRVMARGFYTIGEAPGVPVKDNSAPISREQLKEKMPNIDVSIGEA